MGKQNARTKERKVRVKSINYETMLHHIQQELTNPLESRRLMEITIKNYFVRDNSNKTVHLKDLVKVFGVNWDKRVVEKVTGVTYPYGYVRLNFFVITRLALMY